MNESAAGPLRISDRPILELHVVSRIYPSGENEISVLNRANFFLRPGEIVGLIGPSGSGKSSLLHAAGLLEKPSGGEILIDGKPCLTLDDAQRSAMRRNYIGFVYQFHQLLPEFTALDNVVIPQLIARKGLSEAQTYARELLERLGLGARLHHLPAQLSGGEQQRVAVARAIANRPAILLADEPTGNLDPETSEQVIKVLIKMVREEKLAALIATHNHALKSQMDRVVTVRNGKVVEET